MSVSYRTLILAGVAAVLVAPAFAQQSKLARNFEGIWTNASGTRLERGAQYKELVVPPAEAAKVKQAALDRAAASNAPSDVSENFKDGNATNGYNSYWTDGGIGLMTVKGEARSSFITEPANGRIPWVNRAKSMANSMREGREYGTGAGAYEGPEVLPLRERCLISQSDMGGPVMLSGLYNNTYGMHLTEDFFVIEVEMVHDARIFPIYKSAEIAKASHKPSAIKPWLGDSVAWWEGDTLVTETKNVHPVQETGTATPLSAKGTVTERFTRIADDELLYQFRVEDPTHYTAAWSGEYSFKPNKGGLYEYACHEGNYSIPGILLGARLKEEVAAKAAAAKPGTAVKAKN